MADQPDYMPQYSDTDSDNDGQDAAPQPAPRSEIRARARRETLVIETSLRDYTRALLAKTEQLATFEFVAEIEQADVRLESLFEHWVVVGMHRRTPYRASAFPLALNGNADSREVAMDRYEAEGSLWRFSPARATSNREAHLECIEAGESRWLDADLRLTVDPEDAAAWQLQQVKIATSHTLDVIVEVRDQSGRLLVCREDDRTVSLVTSEQSNAQDEDGNWVYNVLWECSPDVKVPYSGADFLDAFLNEDEQAQC